MPATKTDLFSDRDITLSRVAKALSHPARVAILRELAKRNECVCGQIVDAIPLAQATVSQHLKELKEAGLITGEVEGPRTCYCLDLDGIAGAVKSMGQFLEHLEKQAEKCC